VIRWQTGLPIRSNAIGCGWQRTQINDRCTGELVAAQNIDRIIIGTNQIVLRSTGKVTCFNPRFIRVSDGFWRGLGIPARKHEKQLVSPVFGFAFRTAAEQSSRVLGGLTSLTNQAPRQIKAAVTAATTEHLVWVVGGRV
jgi:hypothetical protein